MPYDPIVCEQCALSPEPLEKSCRSFCRFWKGVLRTHDPVSCVFDLNHAIGQIPRVNVVKRGLEEFSLKNGGDIGDDNDHSWMQRLLA
jgi:hypothetical protein